MNGNCPDCGTAESLYITVHYTTLTAPDLHGGFCDKTGQAVRVQIGNKIYDTAVATKLAAHRTSSGHAELYRTSEGDFFLLIRQIYADGNPLGPHDTWVDLRIRRPGRIPHSRLTCRQGIRPLKRREALEWCIKTQIPQTFRGILLESI